MLAALRSSISSSDTTCCRTRLTWSGTRPGASGCLTPYAARMPSPSPVNPQAHGPADLGIAPTDWSAPRGMSGRPRRVAGGGH